jgi:hypothetical protein
VGPTSENTPKTHKESASHSTIEMLAIDTFMKEEISRSIIGIIFGFISVKLFLSALRFFAKLAIVMVVA